MLELTEANGQTGESGWSIEDAYRRNGSTAGVIDSFKISVRGADPAPGTTRHYRVSAERTPVSQSARSMPRVQVATTRGQGSPKPTSSSCGRCSRRCSTTTALRHEERWRRDGSSCSGTRARSAMRPRTGLFERVRVRRVVDGEAVHLRSPGARELPAARAFDDGRGACRHGRSAGRRRRRGSDLRELSGARVWVEAASWVGGGCRTPSAAAAPAERRGLKPSAGSAGAAGARVPLQCGAWIGDPCRAVPPSTARVNSDTPGTS